MKQAAHFIFTTIKYYLFLFYSITVKCLNLKCLFELKLLLLLLVVG